MSASEGLCNIVSDGTYLYSSNTYEGIICRFTSEGDADVFIKMKTSDKPLCLATDGKILFVYTLRTITTSFGIILSYSLDTRLVVNEHLLPSSSTVYPTLRYNNKSLYLSHYENGTITEINLENDMINTYETGVQGISGMCFVFNRLYFSVEALNAIFTASLGDTVQVDIKFEVDSPKGMDSYEDNMYVCYGKFKRNCGIATYSIIESKKIAVMNYFLLLQIPLNVLFLGSLYATTVGTNVLYKNTGIFSVASFIQIEDVQRITQSVVATNPACVNNPAFRALINLRTVGSNPNNPITPITTIVGRTSGNNIQFNMGIGTSYESLSMRRKAEVLKYKNSTNTPGITLTSKKKYATVVKNGGVNRYSKLKIKQLLEENNGSLPCDIGINNGQPLVITPPSNSGIVDSNFEGYYLNPYLPYYPSL